MTGIGMDANTGYQEKSELFGCWTASDGRLAIRYSRAVIEQIRALALSSFLSIPRGGVEIGGVLFGTFGEGELRVTGHRQLNIEYLTGPSFQLSSKDEENLAAIVESAPSHDELKGLQPVGWYHTHTRSELSLSQEDITVHQRLFPDPRQIALLIKPFKFEPCQGRIFLPEPDGAMRGDAPYCAFELLTGRPEKPGPEPVPSAPAEEPAAVEISTDLAIPRSGTLSPIRFRNTSHPRRWGVAGAAALALIAALAMLAVRSGNKPAPEPLPMRLRVSGSGNEVTIGWDKDSRSIARARSAEILIIDGDHQGARIPLDNEFLGRGTVTYVRQSGNVEVRMRIRSANGEALEEVAHFIGPSPQPAGNQLESAAKPAAEPLREAPDPEVLRMRAEVDRLNGELTRMRPAGERSRLQATAPPAATGSLPTSSRSATAPPEVLEAPMAELRLPAASGEVQLNSPILPANTHVAPPPQPSSPPPQKAAPQKPAAGRAIWTGRLPRGGLLLIEAQRVSTGTLTGKFPQKAARIRVHPADLSDAGIIVYTNGARQNAVEPPSAANGWNLTTYQADLKRSRAITVMEHPSQQNGWARLLLRCEERPVSMLVIDWEEMPPPAARP